MQTLLCASLASPCFAETIACDLSGTPVRFAIDHSQFAPAQDASEPPRRRLTVVAMGDATFSAEPIMMGKARGFWTTDATGAEAMLVMQPDGAAVYADLQTDKRINGTCEVLQ